MGRNWRMAALKIVLNRRRVCLVPLFAFTCRKGLLTSFLPQSHRVTHLSDLVVNGTANSEIACRSILPFKALKYLA